MYSILYILTVVFPDTNTMEYQPIFHGVTKAGSQYDARLALRTLRYVRHILNSLAYINYVNYILYALHVGIDKSSILAYVTECSTNQVAPFHDVTNS